MQKLIRLGSRGSPLALIQAEEVRRKLILSLNDPAWAIEIVPIRTNGDWKPEDQERSFVEIGGNKELFTKEIEDALLSEHIDMAVHSMKDVASRLPVGLMVGAILKREDPHDAFISPKANSLLELLPGSIVGTSSVRRQSQILAHRPDLKVAPLRGNVETRLQKLADGMVDATLLAVAGLARLSMMKRVTSIIPASIMLPAAAQGAIGIEVREHDEVMQKILVPLNCTMTAACVDAERAMLSVLDGSCQTPIGALADIKGGRITLQGLVARPDGTEVTRMNQEGDVHEATNVGRALGLRFKEKLPDNFFAT